MNMEGRLSILIMICNFLVWLYLVTLESKLNLALNRLNQIITKLEIKENEKNAKS